MTETMEKRTKRKLIDEKPTSSSRDIPTSKGSSKKKDEECQPVEQPPR